MDPKYHAVDMQEAADRLDIETPALRRMIQRFLGRDLMDSLKSSFSEGDLAKQRLCFHTMKGSCANLGLKGMSQFAAEAEGALLKGEALPDGTLESAQALWDELKLHFEK